MPAFSATMKREYERLFETAAVRPQHLAEVDATVDRIFAPAAMARYRDVECATGVPAHVVGIIHVREASQKFSTHLHNGDPLTARTRHVPAGRPVSGAPPFAWTESATDALTMPGQALDRWKDWSIGGVAFVLERFNGFGYRAHKVNSPYLWGYTAAYERGLYVADGQWSDTAVNRNPGGMAMLKRMIERGLLDGFVSNSPEMSVGEVQALLLLAGMYQEGATVAEVDGGWGKKSKAAVQRFRQKLPLKAEDIAI